MIECKVTRADGAPCRGVAIGASGLCAAHHPDHRERRRRGASKGGKRGGRGRGSHEIVAVKDQLRKLVALVRSGEMYRGDAAVCGQLLNVHLRALEVQRRITETDELESRLGALEARAGEE